MKNLIILTLLFLSGCSTIQFHDANKTPAIKLDDTQGVLISVPEHFSASTDHLAVQRTLITIKNAFALYSEDVKVSEQCRGVQCLSDEDIKQYGYFVRPTIIRWLETQTRYSGQPDRVKLQLEIFDVKTGEQIADIIYSGKSSFVHFSSQHPEDVLRRETLRYVDSLYRE